MKNFQKTLLFFTVLLSLAQTAVSVVTELRENSGIERSLEPVSFGIPLRMGELPAHSIGGDALLGVNGTPAQFKVLSKWYDGSARWVLATFLKDFRANENKQILIGKGAGSSSTTQLSFVHKGDSLLVNTGAIKVEILKGMKFNIVNRVWRGSNLLVDNSDMRGLVLKPYVHNGDSSDYVGRALTDSVIVEESGPVRGCVYISGRFYRDPLPSTGGTNYPTWNDSLLQAHGVDSVCVKQPRGQQPPYIRFMVRLWFYSGLDEFKITTVIHNTGGNGLQGTTWMSGGASTYTFEGGIQKKFGICENNAMALFFSSLNYDLKLNLSGAKTVSAEGSAPISLNAADRFSFLQNRAYNYVLTKNGGVAGSGTKGDGVIDVNDGANGIAAVYKYCWEHYPKRLDVLGDTLRINLFPRDISPESTYYKSDVGYGTYPNTSFQKKCYILPGGAWYRTDLFVKMHGTAFDAVNFAKARKNPIMPKFTDSYLRATKAIHGFYSDTMRFIDPDTLLAKRVFERKRPWSAIMYDKSHTDGGSMDLLDIWTGSGAWNWAPNQWGHNNAGDLYWGSGYSNLHYDMNLGVLHSYLRTGHYKAWQTTELMNMYKSNFGIYHHENGHPRGDGSSRYEKDDHSNNYGNECKPTHHWTEGMGLYYVMTGDPFVKTALREGIESAFWWLCSRQQPSMTKIDIQPEYRGIGWPVLNLCSGYEILGEEQWYKMLRYAFHNALIPTEASIGPGFGNDTTNFTQMQGYLSLPLIRLYLTIKPADSSLRDSIGQMIERIYTLTEKKKINSGNLANGRFWHPSYQNLNRLDNVTYTDLYAFAWRFLGKSGAREQAFKNAMSAICYHNKADSSSLTSYATATYLSNQYPWSETKLHGKIGLNGRYLMEWENDSILPVSSDVAGLPVVGTEKNSDLNSEALVFLGAAPNPFNPSIKLSFRSSYSTIDKEAELLVYDLRGRLLQRIVRNIRGGVNSFVFTPSQKSSNMASGIYFMNLRVGNSTTKTIRAVMIK
ncbi:MAG: T9SS type A sorting domain-containing protein [Fibrobacteres bacterium]|nr:T9SS type A sorting domain-containing protein [Fibrobacterota bacterium]